MTSASSLHRPESGARRTRVHRATTGWSQARHAARRRGDRADRFGCRCAGMGVTCAGPSGSLASRAHRWSRRGWGTRIAMNWWAR